MKTTIKNINLIILTGIFSLSSLSCSNIVSDLSGVTKTSGVPVTELTDILPVKDNCDDSSFGVKNTVDEQPEESISQSNNRKKYGLKPQPKFINQDLPKVSPQKGEVSVIFHDEYKVRISTKKTAFKYSKDKEEKENEGLHSLSGKEVKKELKDINKLLKDNDARIYGLYDMTEISEEILDNMERRSEEFYDTDMPNEGSLFSFQFEKADINSFVTEIRKNPLVRVADYSPPITTALIPNDTIFQNGTTIGGVPVDEWTRYYFTRVGADNAWNYEINKNGQTLIPAKVAVVDSGFTTSGNTDLPNFDMNQRAYCTPSGCTQQGDVSPPQASNGEHGTEVSSVIGANWDNGSGLAGLAKNVSIIPVKLEGTIVNNHAGFTSQSIIQAINHIRNLDSNNVAHPLAKIINLSLSFPDDNNIINILEKNSNLQTILENAYLDGILCILAAGNENKVIRFEAGYYSGALVVGAVDEYNNRASFSNYGGRIDVAAPGKGILVQYGASYTVVDGTSQSTPMVSAAASLIWGYNPNFTVDQVKNLIVHSATPIYSEKALGPIEYNPTASENIGGSSSRIPGGRVLNIGKAMELASQMEPGKKYLRVFNTDSKTELKKNGNLIKNVIYKQEHVEELLSNSIYGLYTYNEGCYYSWGYQYWDMNSNVNYVEENIAGVAGNYFPVNSVVKNSQWITEANDVFYP